MSHARIRLSGALRSPSGRRNRCCRTYPLAYGGTGDRDAAVGWHAELGASARTLQMAAIHSLQTLSGAWSTWGTDAFDDARDSALAFVAGGRHGSRTQDTRIVARLLAEG